MKNGIRSDAFGIGAAALAVLTAVLLTVLCLLCAPPEETEMKDPELSAEYADILFDDSFVHEIDIRLPRVNWDYMVRFAQEEQYVLCDLIIDGETVKNAAIRPKGNSSLSTIRNQNDDHFSFKIEFDHYTSGSTFHGLDKLALNNLGQDVSCMKDYLVYHLMNEVHIPAPLSSFVHVKLNGEDFGLYLMVEAVEDSFACRNYGTDPGSLYKPECFAIADLSAMFSGKADTAGMLPEISDLGPGDRLDLLGSVVRVPFEAAFADNMAAAALQYLGDDPQAYQVIFDSAVFDNTPQDRERLIRAIRTLNEEPAQAADLDLLIPYFVVHNFVDNYDSYTGIFDHNYYLRESDGKLSLIPWDYNLAFGVFTLESAGASILGNDTGYRMTAPLSGAMDDKTNMVNYPIDTPTFTVSTRDRPLLAAVLEDPEALERYHSEFESFIRETFDSGRFEELFDRAREMIAPYAAAGGTFYSYERFETASRELKSFCLLRAESIRRQLSGALPATMEGQSLSYENLVDASGLDIASGVTFDGMLFGLTSRDVTGILDAVAGDRPHTLEGVAEAAGELVGEPEKLLPLLGKIILLCEPIRNALGSLVLGPVLLLASVITLVIARKRVMNYERRRRL